MQLFFTGRYLEGMQDAKIYRIPVDPLDTALRIRTRYIEQSDPPAGLPDAIMSQIQALAGTANGLPSPELRAFLQIVAKDRILQDQLAKAKDRAGFVRELTQAGTARGFHFLKGAVYAMFRGVELAGDGELNDEQLDAVAAAAQSDVQLMWQIFRNKP